MSQKHPIDWQKEIFHKVIRDCLLDNCTIKTTFTLNFVNASARLSKKGVAAFHVVNSWADRKGGKWEPSWEAQRQNAEPQLLWLVEERTECIVIIPAGKSPELMRVC